MRKSLLLIILISTTIIFYGCNKNSNEDNPVSLYSVDISSLNNKKILDVIHDESLEEGVYQIITDSNKYIFFKGLKNEYVDIDSTLDNKTLIISCNTSTSSEDSNKLYVIREKNTTSSSDKNIFFHTILLKINDNEVPFKSIQTI